MHFIHHLLYLSSICYYAANFPFLVVVIAQNYINLTIYNSANRFEFTVSSLEVSASELSNI